MDDIKDQHQDINDSFVNFKKKNMQYYSESSDLTKYIKNKELKNEINLLLKKSLKKYSRSEQDLNSIMYSIDSLNISLQDYSYFFKILATLPSIELYQKESVSHKKAQIEFEEKLNILLKESSSLRQKRIINK